jgi:hypothetical protein
MTQYLRTEFFRIENVRSEGGGERLASGEQPNSNTLYYLVFARGFFSIFLRILRPEGGRRRWVDRRPGDTGASGPMGCPKIGRLSRTCVPDSYG